VHPDGTPQPPPPALGLSAPATGGQLQSVRLRPTTHADLDFIVGAEGDPDSAPFILPRTRERHAQALAEADLAHLVIERSDGHGRAGFVLLAGLTSPHESIEFKRLVVTAKGQGLGRAAVRPVKRLAFVERKADRLWLDVKEHNARARSLYGSEGFVVEGVLRECQRPAPGEAV